MIKLQILIQGNKVETYSEGCKEATLAENSLAVRELQRIQNEFMAVKYKPEFQSETKPEEE